MAIDTNGQVALSVLGNGTAVGIVVSTVLSLLPPIAAVVALVWYFIQIRESKTVREWVDRRRARKLARMQAAVALLKTQVPVSLRPEDDPELG